jgi:hypothetical protein
LLVVSGVSAVACDDNEPEGPSPAANRSTTGAASLSLKTLLGETWLLQRQAGSQVEYDRRERVRFTADGRVVSAGCGKELGTYNFDPPNFEFRATSAVSPCGTPHALEVLSSASELSGDIYAIQFKGAQGEEVGAFVQSQLD